MEQKKKWEEEDDGRTIADMSSLERPNSMRLMPRKLHTDSRDKTGQTEGVDFDKEERKAYALGALGGALAIGLVYIGAALLLILLLLLLWHGLG